MKKRVIASAIVFVIAAVCVLALCTPRSHSEYTVSDGSDRLIESYGVEDIDICNECELDGQGKVSFTGGDPYIVFDTTDSEFASMVLNFSDNKEGMSVQIFYDKGNGFNESDSYLAYMNAGDNDCVIPLGEGISLIRVDFVKECDFDSVDLHSSEATLEKVRTGISPLAAVLAFVGASCAFAFVFLIDKKFGIVEKLIEIIKGMIKPFLKLTAGLAAALLLGFAAESVLMRSPSFNLFRFVLFTGILFCIAVLIIYRKEIAEKPEKPFLFIALTLCVMFIILTPFGHASWDTESHYKSVLNASFLGKTSYYTMADAKVQSISDDFWPAKTLEKNEANIKAMNDSYDISFGTRSGKETVAHMPGGLFLALGRFLGGTFYNVTNFSKLANALIYCIVCYFAIRKLRSGKMLAAVIALFPTNLFLAASFSYDFWVTAFVILGMAYFIGVQQETDKPVGTADLLIMCIAFSLAILPKLIYVPLLLIPFLMNPKKIDNKKKYYLICSATIVIVSALLLITSFMTIKSGGDSRGGSDVNTVRQIKFILGDPFGYAKMLIKFLNTYLSFPSAKRYITNFAYLSLGDGAFVFIFLMLFTAFTDKNEHDLHATNWFSKSVVTAMFFGTVVLIATSMYVAFTPVGSNTVEGCQERYIIPLLYPLMSMIGMNKTVNKTNRTAYNCFVIVCCALINFYNLATVMLPKWA